MVQIAPRTVLNVIFIVHFTFSVFAMTSKMFANDYLLCQGLIIAIGLWSIIIQDSDPLYMLATINGVTILADSVIIGISWDKGLINELALYRFSAAMAIILVIFKPFMVYFILHLARQRELDNGVQTGSLVDSFPSFGNWGKSGYGPTSTASYQNNTQNNNYNSLPEN